MKLIYWPSTGSRLKKKAAAVGAAAAAAAATVSAAVASCMVSRSALAHVR